MWTLYLSIIQRVVPLFLYGLLGYFVGKRTQVHQRSFATALFYYVVPLVLFMGTLQAKLSPSLISLPILVYAVSCICCLITLKWMGKRWKDGTANLLAFAAGTANSGYFGLPVAMALFSPQGVAVYLFTLMGMTLYESSVGFFVAALGKSSMRRALIKVLTLPTLWAFLLAILCNLLGMRLPTSLLPIETVIRIAYSCLGMMVIGIGIARISRFSFDWPYIRAAFAIRYFLWPVAIVAIFLIDKTLLHVYSREVFQSFLIIAMVPLPSNMVVVASLCNLQPEKAATAVALSIGAGLLFVPFFASLLI